MRNDTEGLITQALLLGNVEAAVELCLKANRFADAIIIAMTGGSDLLIRTQRKYLEQSEGYVSSLISALVSEDWGSIINNCDITSWKEALAATLTHATDEDLPTLCEQLGCRLENESQGKSKVLEDAQLCYICSGSFEKLVSCWSDKAVSSNEELQELVELVTFLQKAVERKGRQVQVSGSLADLLSNYAMILASQGNLQTALNYLGSSTDQKITSLRERLFVHLGQKSAYGQPTRQKSRQSIGRQSFSNYPLYTPQNEYPASTNHFNVPASNLTGSHASHFGTNQNFNTGLSSVPQSISHAWQTPSAPAAAPRTFSPSPAPMPPTQPPKSSNFNSNIAASSTAGLSSRKYVLDPSVTSNQYGTFQRNQAFANQPIGGYPNPHSFNTSPMNPATFTNLPAQSSNIPVPAPSLNPMPLPSNIADFGNSFASAPSHIDQAQEAKELNLMNLPPPAPGWNDPPIMNKPLRNQAKRDSQHSVEPITHPLYGAVPIQQPPNQVNNGFGEDDTQRAHFGAPYNPQEAPRIFQPPPSDFTTAGGMPSAYNSGVFNQNATTSIINQAPSPVPAVQRIEKPVPVPKAPIPEEHMHMKTVFDELRNQCSCAASNPQVKRKLEDVGKNWKISMICYVKISCHQIL
ncbi:hypothetical protein HHI36_014892 [Cryptolaemus montrouzieri]|uniref:SRCR domain-containing protein n=1 Tax=Cryptolaemus montrouzieri TaxID=559131 RepID=A0ABD2N417_9CUCU